MPDTHSTAIVMAIAMDFEPIQTSQSFSAIACLAEFIRKLGYGAIPMGNDTALSLPLAIDAGLGEMGRNG